MSDTTITILVVDDMKVMRELLCAILADDFQTMTAATGEECLGLVDDNPPDLVLLDVNMPGMNGHEICRELRQHAVMATIPIIFVSGAVSDEDRIAGFEVGGDDYITKPIDEAFLISRINLHLARRNKNKTLEAKASESMTMAMEAMTFSSELGLLLQLMKETAEILDYKTLIARVDEVNQSFGLSCSYLVSEEDDLHFFQCEEDSVAGKVLIKCKDAHKIFDFGQRTIFSETHLSILVKNMPVSNEKFYGRLKDHLAVLCNIADQHIRTLQITNRMEKQRQKMLGELIEMCEGSLRQIHGKAMAQNEHVHRVMQGLIEKLENKLMMLGLEEDQEAALVTLVDQAGRRLAGEDDLAAQLESSMTEVMTGLNNLYDGPGS